MSGIDIVKKTKEEYEKILHQAEVDYYAAGLAFEDLAREFVNYMCGQERYIKNNSKNKRAIDIRDVYGRYIEVKSSNWCKSGVFHTPVVFDKSNTTPDIFNKELAEIWYGCKDKLYRYAAKPLQAFLKRCIAENKHLDRYDYPDGHSGWAVKVELKELEEYEIATYNIEKEVRRDENEIR